MHDQPPPIAQRRKASWVWAGAVVLVLLMWAGAFALRGGGEKVVLTGWQDGLDAGRAKAAELDRPMIVFFTSGRCGPCQVFKREVLLQPEVAGVLVDRFVPVQIDVTDNSPRNPYVQVASQYGVSRVPTLLALTAEGEKIDGFPTWGATPERFIAWLDEIER